MKRAAWILTTALAAAYYWLLAGSTTFHNLLARWEEPVAQGAAPAGFYLLSLPRHLAPALWFFWAAGSLGERITRKWLSAETAAARAIVSVLAGFAALAYLFWFLGLAGLFSRPALWAVCVALSAAACFGTRAFAKSAAQAAADWAQGLRTATGGWDAWGKAALAAALFFLILQVPAAHAPSIDRDDLSYQLYIPSSYLAAGGVQPPPFAQRQSFFHQIINMSYVPVLFLGGENAAVLLNVLWSLVLVLAVYALAKKTAPIGDASSWAALCVWALPARFHLAQTASSDLCAACFSLGGLWCLLAWKQAGGGHPDAAPGGKGADIRSAAPMLAWSAFLSAFALNKYTSIGYFIPTVLIFLWLARCRPKEALKGLAWYGGFALLCLAPLALYLWRTKGNPFYPEPLLGLPYDQIEAALQKGWSESRDWATLRGMLKGSLSYLGPWPAMAAAAIPALSALPAANGILLAWLALSLAFKYAAHGAAGFLPRYILAPLAIAPCVTLAWLATAGQESRFLGKAVRIFVLAACLVPGAVISATLARPQWALNLGLLGEDEFLRRFYPSEGWDMARWINGLPQAAKVAVVDHHFIPYRYKDSAAHLLPLSYDDLQLANPRAIAAMLASRNATHVLWVRSQWNARPSGRGVAMSGVLFCRPLSCRWWEENPALPFLRPLYETPGAILFEVAR